jgi:predicted Zn-dependent peptidase
MMFRGTKDYPPEKHQAVITKAGARQNAYTSDDLTNYHATFAKQDLETVLKVEADRVQHPSYGEDAFKTESRAVLGEHNKNSANPQSKLFEAMRDAAFGRTSPLDKRLVQDKQKVDQLYDYTPGRVDPTLATIGARVKKIDDAVYVRDAILRTVAQLRSSPGGAQNLADAKSALKYGLIRSLDNTGQIAGTLASFVHYQRAYGTINDYYRLMDSLTPADLLAAASIALLVQPPALPQLLSPGFREDDFRRLKDAQKNALLLDLKDNNEEEFGKERLQANVYAGSGYGHPVLGTVKGIDNIRLDDVKAFWKNAYTQGEHRAASAHLYQRMRELRGMNYGDYAYIEAFAE